MKMLGRILLALCLIVAPARAQMVSGISNPLLTTKLQFSCTGGTRSTAGNTVIHTFSSSGTLTCTGSASVNYLIVAGGGGGGYQQGGGGGGGGVLQGSFLLSSSSYPVVVGGGGAGATSNSMVGVSGGNSSFNSLTAIGGGGGGSNASSGSPAPGSGGSGGGGGIINSGSVAGGAGTAGQGNAGGATTGNNGGSGGGGAGAVGGNSPTPGGNGGNGVASAISGLSVTYAGGGGGGRFQGNTPGSGGAGGGGNGRNNATGSPGTNGLGGGGGGGGQMGSLFGGGAGGSGIVIISYLSAKPVQICTPGNDAFTYVLMHMDGTNGGTSFPDINAAATGATWSVTGSATTVTSPVKFGTASYRGAASNTYVRSSQNSIYNAGSGNFTIDFWIQGSPANATTLQYITGFGNTSLTNDNSWYVYYDTSKILRFSFQNSGGTGYQAITAATNIMDGNWHYLEFNRNGSALNIYIDGSYAVSSSTSPTGSMRSGSYTFQIGQATMASGLTTNGFLGNIDEYRYSVGIARNTSNYTPPQLPWCN